LGRPDPGLRPIGDSSSIKLLCLDGLAQVGRFDRNVFNPASLVSVEHHQTRIEAVFAPANWGGSVVRAAWSPTVACDGVDLEVQLGAVSVGELKGVEVGVASDCHESAGEPPHELVARVEPRDAASAACSYDGRESLRKLRALSTLPLPSSSHDRLSPWIYAPPGDDPDTFYIEMVQPNDVARRIIATPIGKAPASRAGLSLRHALFGHDLEKGVILRARLRGLWIRSKSPDDEASALLEQFIREPLPLGP
jgi:hypothetical protein